MYLCTLVAREASPASVAEKVAGLFRSHGINPAPPTMLAPHVLEMRVESYPEALKQVLYDLSTDSGVDIIIQQDKESRRKRLVVFDMDSTLIQNECIDLIAAHAGVEKEVSTITEAAMRGELDFSQSLAKRVSLLKGVPITVYDDLKEVISFTPGAKELCKALKDAGVKTAVLSGGFVPLAKWVQAKLGLDYAFANVLEDDGQTLTGSTRGRIVNNVVKAELLQEIASNEDIPLEFVAAVGDGSNDLEMMQVAGLGVAFNAKPIVQKRAPARLNSGNLADLKYVFL